MRFFNPRSDLWREHFRLSDLDLITIEPISEIGEVTARILGFNSRDRLLERQELREIDRYPTIEARRRIN
jgi:hypothetical protein